MSNPALDAGDDDATGVPAEDARGFPRDDFAGVANNGANISDLGAFEAFIPADDSAVTREDGIIVRSAAEGLLANDPGAPLTVDGDFLTTTEGGSILLQADGSYIYVPPTDFSGTDTVDYTMNGGMFTATLTIEVAPAADQPEIRMADASLVGLVPASGETVNTFIDPQFVFHGSIVVLTNGGYAISFAAVTENLFGPENRDVLVRAFAADGTPAGPALQVDGAEASSSPPSLAALPGGGFVAVWQSDPSSGLPPRMQLFTEAGSPVAAAELIGNPGTSRGQGLTPLSNGNFAVTYSDVGTEASILVQIFEPDGDPVGGPITLWASGVDDERRLSSIAADDNGGFVVGWRLPSGGMESFAAQRYDAIGAPIGPEIAIAGARPDSDSSTPVIKSLSDGSLVAAWTSATPGEESVRIIHSQVIGPDGLPEGPEFVSDPVAIGSIYGILQPKLTALAEGYLLTWDKGAEPFGHGIHTIGAANLAYMGRIFDNDGGQVSDEILIHLFESQTAAGTVRYVGNPVALLDGGFAIQIMTYDASGNTRGTAIQLFDVEGNRIGNLADPNSVPDNQSFPTLAVLANGDLAVTWTGFDASGNAADVHSRIMHLTAPGAAVEETAVTIPLAITINELDGSEHITRITVDGVPAGFALSGPVGTAASFNAGTGLWTISGTIPETLSLTLTPPANFNGGLTLKATVFVQDVAGGPEAASAPLVIPIAFANVNDAPVIGSNGGGAAAAVQVAENGVAVATVAAADPDNTPTYSIAGGADAALFSINAATGALTFKATPDFEAPADSGGNNVYDVILRASDGALSDTQSLSIAVTDVLGKTIVGTGAEDVIDAGHTVAGQPLPANEGDRISGKRGDDAIAAGAGDDVVKGGRGDDRLDGGAGDDALLGGKGRNKLTGGEGDDAFIFIRKGSFGRITDYEDGEVLQLAKKAFPGIGPKGVLKAKFFHVGAEAETEDQHILYDDKSGLVLYAKHGSDTDNPQAFLKIGKGLGDLDSTDFLVI